MLGSAFLTILVAIVHGNMFSRKPRLGMKEKKLPISIISMLYMHRIRGDHMLS